MPCASVAVFERASLLKQATVIRDLLTMGGKTEMGAQGEWVTHTSHELLPHIASSLLVRAGALGTPTDTLPLAMTTEVTISDGRHPIAPPDLTEAPACPAL